MKKAKKFLIILGIIVIVILWLVSLILLKSPYIIILSIIFGVILFLIILAAIIDVLFPKSRISEKIEKIIDWIIDNIHF